MKKLILFVPLVLGVGLTLALLLMLRKPVVSANAAPPCKVQQAASGVITVCTNGDCEYNTIQDAVDAAHEDDIIKVAAGTYTDTVIRTAPSDYPNPPAGNIITQVVYISKSLTIRGGYTTTDWTTSDPVVNPTTLDAEGGKRVVFVGPPSGQAITVTLENLRITNGDAGGLGGAPGVPSANLGGGIYIITATATLSGNEIYSNTTDFGTSGVELGSSDGATLSGNKIYGNTADWGTGGVKLWDSDNATLSGNEIYSNTGGAWGGGGVELGGSDGATLSGNEIYYNNTTDYGNGGGVKLWGGDDITLSGNKIYSNTTNLGGGVYLSDSDGSTLSGNEIYSNTADFGGGVHLGESNATLDNNVIADNQAGTNGSGSGLLVEFDSTVHLRHNTIARNTGGDESGVHVSEMWAPSAVTLTNNILVGHTVGLIVANGCTVTLNHTLWATGTAWANVTNWVNNGTLAHARDFPGDPDFVNPGAGNYHIGSGSAAIDRGVEADVATDIDGEFRPDGCFPDLGADEFITRVECKRIYLPLVLCNYGL